MAHAHIPIDVRRLLFWLLLLTLKDNFGKKTVNEAEENCLNNANQYFCMTAQMQCLLCSKNSVTELWRAPEISQFYAVNFELPQI